MVQEPLLERGDGADAGWITELWEDHIRQRYSRKTTLYCWFCSGRGITDSRIVFFCQMYMYFHYLLTENDALHVYVHVTNNDNNYTDVSGMWTITWCCPSACTYHISRVGSGTFFSLMRICTLF